MNDLILVVEDETKLAGIVADYLKDAGYATEHLQDGREVVPWVRTHNPKLVLLDLMLPGRNGLDVCREIRTFSAVPIIMTTAKIEEIDRLLGLELGADDYICKPFSPREVVARVKAVLRRADPVEPPRMKGLVLDDMRYEAKLHDRDLQLTAVEFKLLNLLAGSPGRIFTRQQLMNAIYPDQRIVSDRTIDSHIKKLRRKISVASQGEELIHSLYGVGYKFEI